MLDRVGGGPQFSHDAAGRLTAGPDYQLVRWNERDLVNRIVAAVAPQLDLSYDHDRQLVAMTRTTPVGGAEELLFLGPEHERHAGVDYYTATLDDLPCVAARGRSAVVLTRGMAERRPAGRRHGARWFPTPTELYGPYGSAIEAAADLRPRGIAERGAGRPVHVPHRRPAVPRRLGRFGAVDPVLLNRLDRELLHEPRRISPYLYALGNPHGYVDPSGLLALVDDVIFYGIGSLLGLRNNSFFAGVGQELIELVVGGPTHDRAVPRWSVAEFAHSRLAAATVVGHHQRGDRTDCRVPGPSSCSAGRRGCRSRSSSSRSPPRATGARSPSATRSSATRAR